MECADSLQDKSERGEFDVYFAALGGASVAKDIATTLHVGLWLYIF
jgi:hypothetical protein